MPVLAALTTSFLFGLLHGILPDEHTWPITFSYAVGGASGREGMRAGLYFSAAFTLQRTILSELSYLALAPFLLSRDVNGIVYLVVGVAMSAAGAVVIFHRFYPHIHLLPHRHIEGHQTHEAGRLLSRQRAEVAARPAAPPLRWTIIHGFIAGFGIGGFALFVNTVAAPSMPGPWVGFLPGLLFGLGTMIMLVIVGALFGASLRWVRSLTEEDVRQIGAQTGGRTLFFGGLLFSVFGVVTILGLDRRLPVDVGYFLIGLFMVTIAVPAFIYSWREVTAAKKRPPR